ncbi:hypothetical protein C2I36_10150 [Rhodobacteraceae bacterium WD3A24]|nr:hypothetical protein C2I36_10150 [Rhodobacteraceae bacterium WD3A24]
MNTDLRFYLSILRRRLPILALTGGVAAVLSVIYALSLSPVYRASAELVMEPPQISDELAASTVTSAGTEQLQIIEQRMMTRENLLRMADRFDLFDDPDLEPVDMAQNLRDRTEIDIDTGRDEATLIRLAFRADNAEKAAEVTNAFTTFMLEENAQLRTNVAQQTAQFFQREVERLSQEVQQRSQSILDFRLENRDALPEALADLRARQSERETELAEMRRELDRLEDARADYVESYQQSGRIGVVVEDDYTPFLRRLSSLQQELDVVQAGDSPDPDRVSALRARIASVERGLRAQLSADESDAENIYQRQLASIDEEIETRREEMERIEATLDELGEQISAALASSIRLEALNRDYQTAREQYAAAVDRAATADTGDMIETLSRGQRLTVLERALPPARPESPNRRLIVTGGMFAGLGLGAAIILLLEQLNQTIRRPEDLTRALGIAPFATIPLLDASRPTRRRRLWRRLTGAGGAVAIAAMLTIPHHSPDPMDEPGFVPLAERMHPGG